MVADLALFVRLYFYANANNEKKLTLISFYFIRDDLMLRKIAGLRIYTHIIAIL